MKTHQTENTIKIDPFGDMTRFVSGRRHTSYKSQQPSLVFSISAMENLTSSQLDELVKAIKIAQNTLLSATSAH